MVDEDWFSIVEETVPLEIALVADLAPAEVVLACGRWTL